MRAGSKIAHVVRRFAPSDWGGVESSVCHLSQQLAAQQIASEVYSTDALSHAGKVHVQGVLVRRFPCLYPWVGLDEQTRHALALKGGNPLAPSLFYALLREPGLSLIHTHTQLRLGGMARTAARLRGIPYVVTLHAGKSTLPVEQAERMLEALKGKWEWGKIFGWLLGSRRVLDDADAIICVGRDEEAAIREAYPGKCVRYIPNGVDVAAFRAASGSLFRESVGLTSREKLILCVSRIDYQKNQLLLVRAFARVAQAFPDYRLVLIGPVTVPDYAELISKEAQRLGIQRQLLLIPGYAPDDPRLVSAYRAAEFFILPSVTEPFGIVVLEAWSAGLPVIASRVGGIPGFTQDGHDALLFESQDEEALVQSMRRLMTDENLRQRLAAAGHVSVQAYDWPLVAAQVITLYDELLTKT